MHDIMTPTTHEFDRFAPPAPKIDGLSPDDAGYHLRKWLAYRCKLESNRQLYPIHLERMKTGEERVLSRQREVQAVLAQRSLSDLDSTFAVSSLSTERHSVPPSTMP